MCFPILIIQGDKMKPIFVGGAQRSGTTMLASMIGNHPKIICVPEAQFIVSVYKEKEKNNYSYLKTYELIKENKYFKYFWRFNSKDDNFISNNINKVDDYSELINLIIRAYCKKNNIKKDFDYWVTHDPHNIINSNYLNSVFINSKFIHIIRDGRAVARSLKNVDFGVHETYFTANMWLKQVSLAISTQMLLDKQELFFMVKYEDILEFPEKRLETIADFIGVNYNSNMIFGSDYKNPKVNSKIHSLVGKKPNKNRKNIWKKQLSKKEIKIFEKQAGILLKKLNYEIMYEDEYSLTFFDKIKIVLNEFLHRKLIKKAQKKIRQLKNKI